MICLIGLLLRPLSDHCTSNEIKQTMSPLQRKLVSCLGSTFRSEQAGRRLPASPPNVKNKKYSRVPVHVQYGTVLLYSDQCMCEIDSIARVKKSGTIQDTSPLLAYLIPEHFFWRIGCECLAQWVHSSAASNQRPSVWMHGLRSIINLSRRLRSSDRISSSGI
jgi:hypothetical protein